jgi:sec-independent protein translocase protein TatA
MGLSLSHLLLVLIAVVLVFGAKRLPSIMADLAKGLKSFKDGLHGDEKSQKPSSKHEKDV